MDGVLAGGGAAPECDADLRAVAVTFRPPTARSSRTWRYLQGMIVHAASLLLTASAATAELPVCGPTARIIFREGAPVDLFTIENLSANGITDWQIGEIEILLGPSAGRLVFDTVPGGGGRNVAQPFAPRDAEGAALADLPLVEDGAEGMALSFRAFVPGGRFTFSIDMDDRLAGYGTTVAGPEIEGALVRVHFTDHDRHRATVEAPFDGLSVARPATPCLG